MANVCFCRARRTPCAEMRGGLGTLCKGGNRSIVLMGVHACLFDVLELGIAGEVPCKKNGNDLKERGGEIVVVLIRNRVLLVFNCAPSPNRLLLGRGRPAAAVDLLCHSVSNL